MFHILKNAEKSSLTTNFVLVNGNNKIFQNVVYQCLTKNGLDCVV